MIGVGGETLSPSFNQILQDAAKLLLFLLLCDVTEGTGTASAGWRAQSWQSFCTHPNCWKVEWEAANIKSPPVKCVFVRPSGEVGISGGGLCNGGGSLGITSRFATCERLQRHSLMSFPPSGRPAALPLTAAAAWREECK